MVELVAEVASALASCSRCRAGGTDVAGACVVGAGGAAGVDTTSAQAPRSGHVAGRGEAVGVGVGVGGDVTIVGRRDDGRRRVDGGERGVGGGVDDDEGAAEAGDTAVRSRPELVDEPMVGSAEKRDRPGCMRATKGGGTTPAKVGDNTPWGADDVGVRGRVPAHSQTTRTWGASHLTSRRGLWASSGGSVGGAGRGRGSAVP